MLVSCFKRVAISWLKPICSEILISTKNASYSKFGFPLVSDEIPDCGPIGGLYSALKVAKADFILVLACDMPYVSTEILERMIEKHSGFQCVIPRMDNKIEPLCAIYSKSMIGKIEDQIRSGNFAMHNLIQESLHHFVDFESDSNAFRNINTADEFEKFSGKQ